MFKVKNNLCPVIVKNIFKLVEDPKNTKTFFIPNVNTEYMGKLSLRWFGPHVWENMLPESFKSITSLGKFIGAIKKWIPNNCTCRLCKQYEAGVGFLKTFK